MGNLDIILPVLQRIEQDSSLRILMAVESGSRAWGFASPDSDFDVRFIYVHRPEWYFKVFQEPDTFNYMSDDRLLDFSGWELRKTFQLLSKTNPNLSDWLLTDQIYLADEMFREEIIGLHNEFYNPIHAMYHFYNIATRHDEAYLRRHDCTLKKFLYFLRGVLACEYIRKHGVHPPVNFLTLADAVVDDADCRKDIHELVRIKSQSKEHDNMPVSESLRIMHMKPIENFRNSCHDIVPCCLRHQRNMSGSMRCSSNMHLNHDKLR